MTKIDMAPDSASPVTNRGGGEFSMAAPDAASPVTPVHGTVSILPVHGTVIILPVHEANSLLPMHGTLSVLPSCAQDRVRWSFLCMGP